MDNVRKQRLKRLTHFFSGFLILFHAFERHEHGHSTWWVFATAGVTFLGVAYFHHRLHARWPGVDMTFFIIESLLSFVIMGELLTAGKRGLPLMYCIAGVGQIVAAVVQWRRSDPRSGTTG